MFLKTILSLIAPLGFLRLHLGGGGDGGSGEMRAAEEDRQRKVQAAVDAINTRFGIPASAGSMAQALGAPPDRAQFNIPTRQWVGEGENMQLMNVPGGFDQAGYDKAMAEYEGRRGQIYGTNDEAARARAARDSQYSSIAAAVKDAAMRDVDRQYTTASNRNKFGLARAGLMGGSVDAESGGQLAELYGEGKLKATEAGVAAAADLRSQDERARQNLISLAQSGLDTGTASSMAAGQMAAAADSARGAAAGASVGRLFDDLSQAYVANQVVKARYPQQQQQTSGYGSPNLFGTNRYTGTVGR